MGDALRGQLQVRRMRSDANSSCLRLTIAFTKVEPKLDFVMGYTCVRGPTEGALVQELCRSSGALPQAELQSHVQSVAMLLKQRTDLHQATLEGTRDLALLLRTLQILLSQVDW